MTGATLSSFYERISIENLQNLLNYASLRGSFFKVRFIGLIPALLEHQVFLYFVLRSFSGLRP